MALANRSANVAHLFNESQKSTASHQKHTIAFRNLYRKNPDETLADLKACLKAILVQFKREPAVERCVKYVVRLTTHVGEGEEAPLEDAFAMNVLEWLLSNSCAKDKAVRYRVCQLVQCIMNALSDDAEISDVLWDQLQESMLDRLRDKVPLVRAHAVAALERLQDPSDKEDPVCTEYVRMLQADPSNVVRKAVITHVGISKYTLRHVLARARDVKEDVRAHLYSSLGGKLEMRVLSIKQRVQLLSDGLKDRSGVVREACLDLLQAWVKQAGHPVAFLRAIDVENADEEKLEAITGGLFTCGVDLPKPEVEEVMSAEQTFYWRMWLTDVHTRDPHSSTFENNAPTLTEMCDRIIAGHPEEAVARYTRRQFLLMTMILDFSDESGRRRLLQLVRQLATSLEASATLVDTSMKVIVKLMHGQDSELCGLSMELINDVLDPIDQGSASAPQGNVAELEERKAALLAQERYMEVAEVDAELKALKAGDEDKELRWLRCLSIANELLQNINKANASLAGLLETVVLPGIQNHNGCIRGAAVAVLALLCLLDRKEAEKHVPVLLVHLQNDQGPIKLVALKGLFDLLMMYGLHAAAGDHVAAVMDTLTGFVESEDSDLQQIAVEGLARLLFAGRISDPGLLSKLLLLYFNPVTEELERLRQCLAVFFPAYAFSDVNHQRAIADIFPSTLKTLLKAPRSSPLSQVLPLKVAQFLVYLTDSRSLMHQTEVQLGERSPHALIALGVVQEGLNGDATDGKVYGRVLTQLHADPNDQATVRVIRSALTSLEAAVADKPTVKAIQKRAEELKAIDLEPDAVLAPISPGESAGTSSNASPSKAARRKLNKNKVVECLDDSEEEEAIEAVEAKLHKAKIKEEPREHEEVSEEATEEVVPVEAQPAPVEKKTKKAPAKKKAAPEAAVAEEEPSAAPVTKSQLNKMKVAELREELEKRNLDTKGTKPLLVERLWNVMQGVVDHEDEDDDAVAFEEDTPVKKTRGSRRK